MVGYFPLNDFCLFVCCFFKKEDKCQTREVLEGMKTLKQKKTPIYYSEVESSDGIGFSSTRDQQKIEFLSKQALFNVQLALNQRFD